MAVQYWKHTQSGETYAVQVGNFPDEILGVSGPLETREVTAATLAANDFNFNTDDDAEWVAGQIEKFSPLDPPYIGDELAEA